MTITLLGIIWADSSAAENCLPPPGFKDTPHPVIAPFERLVSHTEEINVDRPLPVVLHAVDKPLSEAIKSPTSLPGITGSHMLTNGAFGTPGSRRLNCLSDGSTLVEEVLLREQRNDRLRFRYVVWNYTSSKARAIIYGLGEFTYSATASERTHIRWTYSFQLNRHRLPGILGGLGDYLFRVSFLDRSYATMMRSVLAATKADSERGSTVSFRGVAIRSQIAGGPSQRAEHEPAAALESITARGPFPASSILWASAMAATAE